MSRTTFNSFHSQFESNHRARICKNQLEDGVCSEPRERRARRVMTLPSRFAKAVSCFTYFGLCVSWEKQELCRTMTRRKRNSVLSFSEKMVKDKSGPWVTPAPWDYPNSHADVTCRDLDSRPDRDPRVDILFPGVGLKLDALLGSTSMESYGSHPVKDLFIQRTLKHFAPALGSSSS